MSDVAPPPPGDDEVAEPAPPAAGRRAVQVAWDRILDAVVYVPVGFAAETVEQLPHWAAKGRARLGMQLGNARVAGHYVVGKAERDVRGRVSALRPVRRRPATPRAAPAAAMEEDTAPPPPSGQAPGEATGRATGRPSLPSDRATGAAAAAAIEGYDTLSASQVVRRLDGLGPEELRAVYRHEAATRGRRTILHRVQQLLQPPPPAPTAAPSAAPRANGSGNGTGVDDGAGG